jgi:hypothetical protein
MDETMVIDPASQKRMLEATAKAVEEVLGGFVIVEGSADKREYELKDRVVTIGKDESAAIRLKGFFAPAVAALVNRRKEGYFMTPASGKSFKVNGQDVKTRYDLKDGDLVEVGNLKCNSISRSELMRRGTFYRLMVVAVGFMVLPALSGCMVRRAHT